MSLKKYVVRTSIAVAGLLICFGLIYYYSFSLSSIIRADNFSRNDIVTTKEYSNDSGDQSTLILLANESHVGLITAEKSNFGFWSTGTSFVTNDLTPNNYAVNSVTLIDVSDGDFCTETIIFLATYTDKVIAKDTLVAEDFEVSLETFAIDHNNLLFVEATADEDKESFDSDEVVLFLQDKFGVLN